MQAKFIFRIIFISILTIGAVYGGIYAFMKLKSNEEVYNTDLITLVPTDSEMLLYIRNPEKLPENFPNELLPEQSGFELARALSGKSYRNDINVSGSNELVLSYQGKESLIFYRTTADAINAWEKQNRESERFLFSPQKETYKDIDISVYLTSHDRFFCFAYYQGAFIGSHSKNLLYKALDMYTAKETLKNDSSFTAYLKISSENAMATCFFKKEHWASFDISADKDKFWISGCLMPEYSSPSLYRALLIHPGTETLNNEYVPAQTSGLVFINTDSTWLSSKDETIVRWNDSLVMEHASGSASVAYFSTNDTTRHDYKVCLIAMKDINLFMRNLVNRMARNYPENPGMSIRIVDIPEDITVSPIYRLPPAIKLSGCTQPFFHCDSTEVFTLYGQNLLISDSREALRAYLKEIHPNQTAKDHGLMKMYNEHKNEDTSVFLMIDGNQAFSHASLCEDIIPDYFLDNPSFRKYHLFLQFNKGEGLVYYTGMLDSIAKAE